MGTVANYPTRCSYLVNGPRCFSRSTSNIVVGFLRLDYTGLTLAEVVSALQRGYRVRFRSEKGLASATRCIY